MAIFENQATVRTRKSYSSEVVKPDPGVTVTKEAIIISGKTKRELDEMAGHNQRTLKLEVSDMVDEWLVAYAECLSAEAEDAR